MGTMGHKTKICIRFFIFLALLGAIPIAIFIFKTEVPPPFEVVNYFGDALVYTKDQNDWSEPNRGDRLEFGDIVRTGPKSEFELSLPGKIHMRIKEKSQVELRKPKLFSKETVYRIQLSRGIVLGAVEKSFVGQRLEILTPNLVVPLQGATFKIVGNPEIRKVWIGVLKGIVEVYSRSFIGKKVVPVHGLEKTEIEGKEPPQEPERVEREEWDTMKEAYELTAHTAAFEARQMDLSKEAGGLFDYVFDHGTFFTPRIGYTKREFIKNEKSGKVHLEIEYDVFPTGSFVGVYLKTRDFDISKYKSLRFDARRDPDEQYPEKFRLELKVGRGVIRSFKPAEFKKSWRTYELPLGFHKSTLVNEITFVFSNDQVGEHKKGMLQFRNFELVPLDEADQGTS